MAKLDRLARKQIRTEMVQKLELENLRGQLEIAYSELRDDMRDLRTGRLLQKHDITVYEKRKVAESRTEAKKAESDPRFIAYLQDVAKRAPLRRKMQIVEDEYAEIIEELEGYHIRDIAKRYGVSGASVIACYTGRIGWTGEDDE